MTFVDRGDRAVQIRVGEQHPHRVRRQPMDLGQEADPVPAGHPEVGYDNRERRLLGDRGQSIGGTRGGRDVVVATQTSGDALEEMRLVVDTKNA